ncbi:hypothetical protein HPP92_013458 [Vanilla planifolia]|uniref:AP2/ERF domain-containing protein n=1 Tax=Vanilla planifolia TaxID=51239 RepID=A0A835QYM4_VANPL|nr:hypothetical protein HPP92_013458 [Vanilla planifolia]
MVLDLNLVLSSIPENLRSGHLDALETSNYSVIDADVSSVTVEDFTSAPPVSRLGSLMDFTNGEDDLEEDDDGNRHSEPCLVTIQLFPTAPMFSVDGVEAVAHSSPSSSSSRKRSLNIGYCKDDLPELAEVNFLEPQRAKAKKRRRGPRSRSSQFRGVTFYKRTGRWESHIWDCGKQVYLGGFDTAYAAARAYDWAAIKFRGVEADINFNLSDYREDLKRMKKLTKEELVRKLRGHSTVFSKGSSKYRGMTLHKFDHWKARTGQLIGKKAYDMAATKFNGNETVTNSASRFYDGELPKIGDQDPCRCIDLNLSISQPYNCNTKGIIYPIGLQTHCSSFGVSNVPKIKIDIPSTISFVQPHHLAVVSEYPQDWNTTHTGHLTNREGRTMDMKAMTRVHALPSCARQIHAPLSVPIQLSFAASSGFYNSPALPNAPQPQQSSSTTSSHLQLLPQDINHNYSRG